MVEVIDPQEEARKWIEDLTRRRIEYRKEVQRKYWGENPPETEFFFVDENGLRILKPEFVDIID